MVRFHYSPPRVIAQMEVRLVEGQRIRARNPVTRPCPRSSRIFTLCGGILSTMKRDRMVQHRKRSSELGMSFSTAYYRMQRNFLWYLAYKAGMSKCYVCKEPTSAAEFTIEHIKPWQNRSTENFWNMENLALSHANCNRRHDTSSKRRIEAPKGKSWCAKCKGFKLLAEFHKNRSRWNGIASYCTPCHNQFGYARSEKRKVNRTSTIPRSYNGSTAGR
jgi:5-methylcytosine-specific restriction endonuclease McrA